MDNGANECRWELRGWLQNLIKFDFVRNKVLLCLIKCNVNFQLIAQLNYT